MFYVKIYTQKINTNKMCSMCIFINKEINKSKNNKTSEFKIGDHSVVVMLTRSI